MAANWLIFGPTVIYAIHLFFRNGYFFNAVNNNFIARQYLIRVATIKNMTHDLSEILLFLFFFNSKAY